MKLDEKTWTERYDPIIRIASPEVAAKKLGCALSVVLARRQEQMAGDLLGFLPEHWRREATRDRKGLHVA